MCPIASMLDANLRPNLPALFDRARRWIKARAGNAADRDELAWLDADEQRRLAAAPRWELSEMMRRIGIDESAVRQEPAVMQELQRVCTFCTTRRRCRWWLEAARLRGYEEFCPNAPTLAELARASRPATLSRV